MSSFLISLDLAEFSNVDPEPVTANNDDWAAIECVPPNHRPGITNIYLTPLLVFERD